jgi:hypothetical protein
MSVKKGAKGTKNESPNRRVSSAVVVLPLRLCATPASLREALQAGSLREIFLSL